MRRARLLSSVVLPLLAVFLLSAPAWAGDEAETWTYRKGDETRELDVSSMSEQLRSALDKQMKQAGWERQLARLPSAEDEAKAVAKGKATVSEATKKDLEELVRRGGRLPEGFVPHGMGPGGALGGPLAGGMSPALMGAFTKATGKLLLRYLEVKDDPVKGPIYEDLLRDVAKQLVDADPKGAGLQQLGMRMMGKVMGGMQDPDKGPVYREILGLFSDVMGAVLGAGPAGPPTPPAPRARGAVDEPPAGPRVRLPRELPAPALGATMADAPRELGGALLVYMFRTRSAQPVVRVGEVPEGSLAEQLGLVAGDEIVEVDGQTVSFAGLRKAVKALADQGKLILQLRRTDRDGKTEIRVLDIAFGDDDQEDGADEPSKDD